ncbi:MAG: Fe-S cluster assembly protein SufD, partial [Porphyromonadaceae bacterium]|nr:Fe-S cluster assembly protein SufD [Porphyromonadaceae bacterium]
MDAQTKHYLDLYAAHADELRQRVPLLQHYREEAFDAFARLGLPAFKSEDYQRTDLPKLFEHDWQLLTQEGSPYWASQVVPEGVFIGSISDFARLYPEVAQEHYARIAPVSKDGLVALSTLLVNEVFVVYVPRGLKVPGHIELGYILPRTEGHLAIERALFIVEDAAELAVYYKDCPEEDVRAMTLRTLEVYVGRGARFSLIDREESGLDNIRLTSTYVRQMGGSHADLSTLTLRNGTTRNN